MHPSSRQRGTSGARATLALLAAGVTRPLALGLALGAAAGCARGPAPCVASTSCARGLTCAAGRCAKPEAELAPSDAQRILVAATEIAVVSSRGHDPELPREIPLGRATEGSLVVLLRFPTPWGNRGRVASAFLTLEPLPGALPEGQPVPIVVARVLTPWSAAEVSWERLPTLSPPEARAFAMTGPPRPLRIDVTALVQRWARGRASEQGIALWASGDAPAGVVYATGVSGAAGPRLDVYVR